MLELRHISKTFYPGTVHEKTAMQDLSLTLQTGDFVTILGSNGAGKSTLFNAVAGAFAVDSGRIVLDGMHLIESYVERFGPPDEIVVSEAGLGRAEIARCLEQCPGLAATVRSWPRGPSP